MLLTECGATMAAAWTFDTTDPAAVQLVITAKPLPVPWTMSRALLRDGLCAHRLSPAGEGDIQLHTRMGVLGNAQPDLRGVRRPILVIDLAPPGHHVRLFMEALIAQSFLRRTYGVVTEGRERNIMVQQVAAAVDWFQQVQS